MTAFKTPRYYLLGVINMVQNYIVCIKTAKIMQNKINEKQQEMRWIQ